MYEKFPPASDLASEIGEKASYYPPPLDELISKYRGADRLNERMQLLFVAIGLGNAFGSPMPTGNLGVFGRQVLQQMKDILELGTLFLDGRGNIFQEIVSYIRKTFGKEMIELVSKMLLWLPWQTDSDDEKQIRKEREKYVLKEIIESSYFRKHAYTLIDEDEARQSKLPIYGYTISPKVLDEPRPPSPEFRPRKRKTEQWKLAYRIDSDLEILRLGNGCILYDNKTQERLCKDHIVEEEELLHWIEYERKPRQLWCPKCASS